MVFESNVPLLATEETNLSRFKVSCTTNSSATSVSEVSELLLVRKAPAYTHCTK